MTFHVEHVVASQHGCADTDDNLALACDRCNAYKGPNISAIDPQGQRIIRLFNPRIDRWLEHFAVEDYIIIGLTPVGRATTRLLNMNATRRVQLRMKLAIKLMS